MSEVELIAAVVRIRLSESTATAKQIHDILTQDAAWADTTLSQVKKACSKAAKQAGPAPALPAGVPPPASKTSKPSHDIPTFPVGPEHIRQDSLLLSGRKPQSQHVTVPVGRPDGDQTAMVLSLGVPGDFAFLKKLEKVHLAGIDPGTIGSPANGKMAAVVCKALAAQTAWKDAPDLVKEAQPILVALFLDKVQWLSRADLDLTEQLGYVQRRADGAMSFKHLIDVPHLFPLAKAALEPCEDVRANYELGLRWLRAQQMDPQRPKSLLEVLRSEAAHGTYVEDFATLHLLASRMSAINNNRSAFRCIENPATPREGVKGMLIEITFAGQPEINVPNVFVPLLIMGAHLKKEAEKGKDPFSAEALAKNGFPGVGK